MTLMEIKAESPKDRNLVAICNALLSDKWYDNPLVEPYRKFKNELSNVEGIILRGDKI